MIKHLKSFPIRQIIFIFVAFCFLSCGTDSTDALNNEKFIEIYARLLIISELDISKEYQDKLIGDIYRDFQVTQAQIDSSIATLNANPDQWVEVLEKTRDKIQELRKEMLYQEKGTDKADQAAQPARAPVIRDVDDNETRTRRFREKLSRDKTPSEDIKKDPRK